MYGVRIDQQQPQQQPQPGWPPQQQPGWGPPAGAQGGYGQFTFPVIPKQKLEPMAVAAIATSPLGVIAIVLGLIARGRVKRTQRRSAGLAWTGVVLGAVFTLGWGLTGTALALSGTFDHTFEQPVAGDASESRTIVAANLATGNCVLTLPPATAVGEVTVVPCAQEHIAQVVNVEQLSGDFPGEGELAAQATESCTAAVEQIDAGDASIMPWYLVPSAQGWSEGNTQILCMVRGGAGPLTVDLVNG